MATPSTSTRATPRKVPIRRVPVPLIAFQALEEHFVDMDGRDIRVFPNDWVITNNGNKVVDVQSPKQFSRFYEHVIEGRLQIEPEQRSALEYALGAGSTDTADHLVTAVRRVAALSIGDIPITFTPPQWEELARRADKRGLSTSAYVAQVVDRLLQDLWTSA